MSREHEPTVTAQADLAASVKRSLGKRPRQLSCAHLYDALGSHLFEAICQLPWYRITRAESQLLARHAAEITALLGGTAGSNVSLVELGCGSGEKLAVIGGALSVPVTVHLVDISPTALELSARTLGRLPHLQVHCHDATYEAGLQAASAARPAVGTMMVLFLGSNIGNLDEVAGAEFLRGIRRSLRPGDALLLGADLVKPEADLLLAYDDPLGVTAAFNKNLLVRLNREIAADFDLGAWDHRATWNAAAGRVEMHLVSRHAQRVQIPRAELTLDFAAGETIWTESSYKYRPDQVVAMGDRSGFTQRAQWLDHDARFALTLFNAR